jgi:hypothetical protein
MFDMKRIVGIVAAMVIAGCGVGVDDPEGEASVGTPAPPTQTASQALYGADLGLTVKAPIKAPQDPIPAFGPVGGDPTFP